MKVFLTKKLDGIGEANTIVELSSGYVRNFILPNNYGVELNPGNEKLFEKKIKAIEKQKEEEQLKKSDLFNRLNGYECTFRLQGKGGTLYGSVDEETIASFLTEKGFKINKKQILLDKAIKKAGEHSVVIKLSSQLKPTLIVKVIEKKDN